MQGASLTSQFALDVNSVARLRAGSSEGIQNNESLEAAAKQFEAIFLQKMLTSMRDAYLKSDLMSSPQTEFYDSLMDQQWAQQLSSHGIGLADQLVRQLRERGASQPPLPASSPISARIEARDALAVETPSARSARGNSDSDRSFSDSSASGAGGGVSGFVDRVLQHARRVEAQTGLSAELMTAQAILETGWGRREILRDDGTSAHNLFGIKAGSNWSGDTVEVVTHEYIGERRVQVKASFRAYASYEESFADYARLISENPRYAGVIDASTSADAIQALVSGGYATEPAYAETLQALLDQKLSPRSAGSHISDT
jgi:flagellar protein FlgJ